MEEEIILKWRKIFASQLEKKEREAQAEKKHKQAVEWGRLGGRPKKEKTKSVTISIRSNKKEKEILKERADKVGLSLSEFLLRSGLGIALPDAERNRTLIEYRMNFKRIANHFRSNVWTDAEKEIFKTELEQLIKGIEKELR